MNTSAFSPCFYFSNKILIIKTNNCNFYYRLESHAPLRDSTFKCKYQDIKIILPNTFIPKTRETVFSDLSKNFTTQSNKKCTFYLNIYCTFSNFPACKFLSQKKFLLMLRSCIQFIFFHIIMIHYT